MTKEQQISWIQKQIDILRKILHLQTMKEKMEMEDTIRRIAQAYSVDVDVLVAVLKCESGLNPRAVNRNSNGTTDYGLCQFNDYWYRDIIAPEVALNMPETAVSIMCQMWEQGRQNDWICYRNKKYIQHLKPRL